MKHIVINCFLIVYVYLVTTMIDFITFYHVKTVIRCQVTVNVTVKNLCNLISWIVNYCTLSQ